MKTVFYTFVSDDYYYPIGTHKLINSFKRFHPDIDLVIFRQDMIDKIFKEHNVNFFNAKPTFAKLLVPYYELIVNIDADSVVLGRCDEILKGDYDVGAAWNFNDYENRTIGNVKEDQYLQAGLVGATNPKFWDIWERENANAHKYVCAENDVLSLIWYNDPELAIMKKKIYDKGNNLYYGCKSLNLEKEFYIEDTKIMCRSGQVKIYHHAKGGGHMPKLDFSKMGFPHNVASMMQSISMYGKSVIYSSL